MMQTIRSARRPWLAIS